MEIYPRTILELERRFSSEGQPEAWGKRRQCPTNLGIGQLFDGVDVAVHPINPSRAERIAVNHEIWWRWSEADNQV
jgi:hypothetical protein